MKFLLLSLLALQLAALSAPAKAQSKYGTVDRERNDDDDDDDDRGRRRKERPKASMGEILGTTSGIGLDLYRPTFTDPATANGLWKNVNVLLYVAEFQAGFGKVQIPGYNREVYGRNASLGINIPIAPGTIGFNSGRSGSLLRGHFFGALNFGGMTLWERDKQFKSTLTYVGLAPGVRVYNNFLTAELRLQGLFGLKTGDGYEDWLRGSSFFPVLTVRANGMFNRLVRGQRLVGSTSYSISDVSSSSTTDRVYRDGVAYDRTTTTTTGTVHSSRGTTVLNDIGTYVGIGPRVSFTRPMADYYSSPSLLLGGQIYLRAKKLILGLNVETGKAGHASITRLRGDDKRKIDRSQTYAAGELSVTNAFVDFGLDITSLAKGLLGTLDDENSATTFADLNFGYSVGFSLVGGQEFENKTAATAALSALQTQRSDYVASKTTDPRKSSSGVIGGWFVGFDVGNVGMRLQWYRYKNAPLANELYYTLSYRFSATRK